MAKISLETVQSQYLLNSDKVSDDSIKDLINSAYRFLSSFCGLRTSDNTFFGFFDTYSDKYVYVNGISDDIVLTKITINDIDINLTDDISQFDRHKWEVTNSDYIGYDRFYVEYTSDNLLSAVNGILKEHITYYYKRLPGTENFIHQTEERLEDEYIKRFVSPGAFERQLSRRLSELFPKGVGQE